MDTFVSPDARPDAGGETAQSSSCQDDVQSVPCPPLLERAFGGLGGDEVWLKPTCEGERQFEMPTRRAVEETDRLLGEYRPKDPEARRLLTTHRDQLLIALAWRTYTKKSHARTHMGFLLQFALYVVQLGAWSPDSNDPLPISQRYVQLFCEQLQRDGKVGAQTVYSALSGIGSHYQPHLWPRRKHPTRTRNPKAPYSTDEQETYRSVGLEYLQETGDGRLLATIAAGFGAGLSVDCLRVVRGTDVTRTHSGDVNVTVTGGATLADRTIPVVDHWADDLHTAATTLGNQLLVSGQPTQNRNLMQRVTVPLRQYADLHLAVSRMRSTWLIGLIAAGVPSDIIVDVAGVQSTQTFRDLHTYIDPRTPDQRDRWARHGGRPC